MLRELKTIDKDIFTCLQCGYCESTCPIYDQVGWESVSPRGKIYYLKQLRNRGLLDKVLLRNRSPSPEFIKRIYQCAGCGACEEVCHTDLKLQNLWLEVKESLVEENINLPEAISSLPFTLENNHSPYKNELSPHARNKPLIDTYKLPKKAEYVFFIGCAPSSFVNSMVHSSIRILQKAEVDFTILENEWCCGSVLGVCGYGNSEVFRDHASHNLDLVKASKAGTLIASCPWCYKSFKEIYPRYDIKTDFNVFHFTEFLTELIEKDRLSFKKAFDRQVTYHDPCRLGRLSGIFEPPRKILESIPKIKLTELTNNRSNCRCCGNYCGISAIEPELALSMSINKIHEAMNTSAEVLVSSCPNCRHGLGDAQLEWARRNSAAKEKLNLEIMDLTELVAELI